MTTQPRRLAWIDLETTGQPEPWEGSLLEVALYVTEADPTLLPAQVGHPPFFPPTWDWLVDPDPAHVATMPDVVRQMHTESGLLDEIDRHRANHAAGRYPDAVVDPPSYVDHRLATALDLAGQGTDGTLILAGSGVGHYDARWIRWHLPLSAARLTYYAIDVGVLRRTLRMAGILPADRGTKAHRALDDAVDHADEARTYLGLLAAIPAARVALDDLIDAHNATIGAEL